MSNNWIDAIKEIRKAKENDRLVIFVGAGVSKNSGLPLWGELISYMAKEIGYEHCSTCKKKADCSDEHRQNCEDKERFTQEEYLRIPEYMYEYDNKRYTEIIREVIDITAEPNEIDDEILNILPHHIITTNYDNLLETSNSINASFYKVVANDNDLLSGANNRYIIKMHGDLKEPESLVLKERDYLDYEQRHIIISTFIKALLVDHTFLFLGYSLNDSNLNLIIGWINYFAKALNVNDRPLSFLLSNETPSSFERSRLLTKDISVIDLSEIPEVAINQNPSPKLTNEIGKKYYCFLKLISKENGLDDIINSVERLEDKYAMLMESYNFITYSDLKKVASIGQTDFCGCNLCFIKDEDYDDYKNAYESSEIIKKTISKTGVNVLYSFMDDSKVTEIEHEEVYEEDIWRDYENYDYIGMKRKVSVLESLREKLYFSIVIHEPVDTVTKIIKQLEQEKYDNIIELLIIKMTLRLASMTYYYRNNTEDLLTEEIRSIFSTLTPIQQKATSYMHKLFFSSAEELYEMQNILDKQEEHYKYQINGYRSASAHHYIYKLQAFAYDYYRFVNYNYLPIHAFSDTKRFFSYYVRAILCSYSPTKSNTPDGWFIETHREPYSLNEIDLDVMVRHTRSKDFKNWLKEYKVESILLDEDVDVALKFGNLCKSFSMIKSNDLAEEILIFSKIISRAKVSTAIKTDCFREISAVVIENRRYGILTEQNLLTALSEVAKVADLKEAEDYVAKLTETIANNYNLKDYINIEDYYIRIIQIFAESALETKGIVNDRIQNAKSLEEKSKLAYMFRFYYSPDEYKELVDEIIFGLNPGKLFNLIIEGYAVFDEKIEAVFLNEIDKLYAQRKATPEMRSFPDYLKIYIDEFIILHLIDDKVDVSKIFKYKDESVYVQFLMDSESFDYSTIDTSDYMWMIIARSEKYRQIMKAHKDELLSQMEEAFRSGNETRDQQKLVYGMLLSEKELWSYGK